jgi:Periplasmic component of the Tol biopolymer transport system
MSTQRKLRFALLATTAVLLAGCFSRRGNQVGPFPGPPPPPGLIAFASNRDDGHAEIYVMQDDRTHLVRLTFNSVTDAAPLLSPDGTKITFRRELNPASVFVMNVDGSHQIGLAPGERAEWSPDGTKLALVADSLGVMNSDGTGKHSFPIGASLVAWSPDGLKLAYVSTGVGGQHDNDVYIINSNGTAPARITQDGIAKNSLAWSPDGTKILYSATQSVYVMNTDGSGVDSPVAGRSARWSPNGERIIFVTDAFDGNEEIYSIRIDGSDLQNMTQNAANDSDPDWGPRP